jgi:hypothetical protein
MIDAETRFATDMHFKVQGAIMYPKDGMPRKATAEERALWSRAIGLLAEIETLQPWECSHERTIRITSNDGRRSFSECVVCKERV